MGSQKDAAAQSYTIVSVIPTQRQEYGLTKREKQILNLLAEGLTMKGIARQLGLSYNTMTTHFKNIYRKLNVHNKGLAIAKALKENLC